MAGLWAGGMLMGANADVKTADVYFPIAGGDKSLMSEFQASVVTSVRIEAAVTCEASTDI